jgi:very-short-patch-repair endonuclease
VRLILRELGLHPQPQVLVVGRNGRRYRVDFDVDGVLIECEGFAYHGSPEAHEADTVRFNELARALPGRTILRITWRQAFVETEATKRLILDAVVARRATAS